MAPQPSRWTVGAIWTILVLSIILDYPVPLGGSGRFIDRTVRLFAEGVVQDWQQGDDGEGLEQAAGRVTTNSNNSPHPAYR